MGFFDDLFNSFKETIFLKEDSDLNKQLEELKSIRDTCKNKNEIGKDIKLLELGIKGENEISYELKNANLGLYVLRDITIEYEGNKAQIDYVIISKGYTYLVECKNLIGNIYVDSKGQFQREYEYNHKKIREAIYSPYAQAVRHKEILKKRWQAHNSKLIVAIREQYFDNLWYKPLVVLANSKSILNTRTAPKEIRNSTIRADQLVDYIKNDLRNYDNDLLSNQKSMEEQAQKWLEINIPEYNSIANKYKENDYKSDDSELLISKLRTFRTEKSRSMKVPAYYVFNDDEMKEIARVRPQQLDELRKILSPIKIKCHGEEILKIINED